MDAALLSTLHMVAFMHHVDLFGVYQLRCYVGSAFYLKAALDELLETGYLSKMLTEASEDLYLTCTHKWSGCSMDRIINSYVSVCALVWDNCGTT